MPRHATFDMSRIDFFTSAVNAEQDPVLYLSIDTGEYNGVCGYEEKAYIKFAEVISLSDLSVFLRCFKTLKKCIHESFFLFPHKAKEQIYSNMPAVRAIGRIEDWAQTEKIPLVAQQPSVKATGYKWLGKKPPTKSSNKNDTMDAHVHFIYWAVRNKVISVSDLLR